MTITQCSLKFELCSKDVCWWYTGCAIYTCMHKLLPGIVTTNSQWDLIPLFTDSGIWSYYLQTLGFYSTVNRPWDFIPLFADPGILYHCLKTLGFYTTVYRLWDFIPLFTGPGILSHCHTHQIPCHSVSAVDSPVGWCSRHGNWTVPVQWFSHVVLGRGSQVL